MKYTQTYRPPVKKKMKGMWPVIGFLMACALGVIAFVLAPSVQRIVIQITRGGFTGQEMPPDQMRLFFTGAIFLVLGSIAALIVAFAVPKKKNQVQDAEMRRQKEVIKKEDRARKVRARVVEHEMKKQNRRIE
jgi:hypothetical protein